MTEVTKSNYEEKLPEVFEAIREADFIAIDCNAEATGFLLQNETVNLRQLKNTRWYDYILDNQTTRSPLDFGISIFKQIMNPNPSSKKKHYQIKAYNFPIFFSYVEEHDARQEIRDARYTEERLNIDAMGFEFIQRINFDLNKTIYDGTPFMNRERQEDAIYYMEKYSDFMTISGKHVTNGDLDRKLFPDVVEKLGPEDIQKIVSRLRGIGKFFDVTAESKVPVIGHNLLIKLMMLYKDFVEYLPNEFSTFLEKLEKVLPQFYDTKFIAEDIPHRNDINDAKKNIFKGDTKMYELFRNTDWIGQFTLQFSLDDSSNVYNDDLEELKTNIIESDNTSFCHESGFDATIAGILFTKLIVTACNDFSLDILENQCRSWRNQLFIPKELENELRRRKPNRRIHVDSKEFPQSSNQVSYIRQSLNHTHI